MRLALLLIAASIATLGSWIESTWLDDLAASLLIATALALPRPEIPKLAAIPLALFIWAALQCATGLTAYRHASLRSALYWAAAAAAYVCAVNLLRLPRQRLRALTAFAALAGLLAAFSIFQPQLAGTNPDTQVGPFLNRNTYASFVELALAASVWLALRPGPAQWLWWAASLALIASVIHSGSRAGAAIVLLEAIVLAIHATQRARFAFLAACATLCALLGATLWTRMQYGDPLVHRREIYGSALQMIAEKPLAGHGMGTFQWAYPRFATFDVDRYVNHAHNDWLEIAATGGLPVALALLAFFILNCKKVAYHPWAYGIPAVLLHASIDFPLQRMGVFSWLIVLTGAIYAACSTGHPVHTQSRRGQPLPVQQVASV